jgi:hypothetical protein
MGNCLSKCEAAKTSMAVNLDKWYPILRASEMELHRWYLARAVDMKKTTWGQRVVLIICTDGHLDSDLGDKILFLSASFNDNEKKVDLIKLFEDPSKCVYVKVTQMLKSKIKNGPDEKELEYPVFEFKSE